MQFAYPWVLILVFAPLIYAFVTKYMLNVRQQALLIPSLRLWQDETSGRARWLWVLPLFEILGFMCLVVALARPQSSSSHAMQASEGIAIQLLVDVSSSMSMNIDLPDGKAKSRMLVAKELVQKFIGGDSNKLKGREGDLLGLITFARYADTRSPLTFGHDALLQIVKTLTIQQRENEDGTAYGDALALAAARLKQLDNPEIRRSRSLESAVASRVIILLTDGENNSGSHLPVEAAGLAKSWGCKIYCISLGDRPVLVSQENADAVKGATEVLLSDAERVLSHIASETGGMFRTAHDYDTLLSVYSEIDQLERSRIVSRSYTRVSECFGYPLALCLFLLLISILLNSTYLRTIP